MKITNENYFTPSEINQIKPVIHSKDSLFSSRFGENEDPFPVLVKVLSNPAQVNYKF